MDYDVLVLGGGIAGCAVAYELSKYNLNIALIERDYDIVDDISFVNASIIYDGSEAKDDTIALLESEGRKIIEESCERFKVTCKKIGAMRIASDDTELEKINLMNDIAKKRGLEDVSLIDVKEVYKKNSGLKHVDIRGALYSKHVSVLNPYELAIAYGEIAADNGVNFRFQEEVINIEQLSKSFKITTNKNKFSCKVVIDTISKEKDNSNFQVTKDQKYKEYMTYLMIENKFKVSLENVIIDKIDNGVQLFNIPTLSDELIIAIKSKYKLTQDKAVEYCKKILPNISGKNVINMFTEEYENTMIIDYDAIDRGYIRLAGSNYSKLTLTPAISKVISEIISNNLKVKMKKDFIDKRREVYRFSQMTDEERNEIIKIDKRYGNIVCVCNQVSEGEIIDCIRRPLGARTVEGIKKRTGAGLGSCYGSYCSRKIIKILAKEIGINPTEVVQDEKNSRVWTNRIKEFDKV